jgi:hypothetical protein
MNDLQVALQAGPADDPLRRPGGNYPRPTELVSPDTETKRGVALKCTRGRLAEIQVASLIASVARRSTYDASSDLAREEIRLRCAHSTVSYIGKQLYNVSCRGGHNGQITRERLLDDVR